MNSPAGILLRLAVLASVVLGMPLMALPTVRQQVVAWWQDPGRSVLHRPATLPGPARLQPLHAAPAVPGGDTPAPRPDTPAPRADTPAPRADTVEPTEGRSPPFPGEAEFHPAHDPELGTAPGDPIATPAALSLTDELRQRLVALGAAYLMVEQLPDSGLYRCLCLVDVPGTTYQRPFQADDLAADRALQRVLAELEHWTRTQAGRSGLHLRAAPRPPQQLP